MQLKVKNMKNSKLFSICFLSLLLVGACTVSEPPEIGEPSDKLEGISDEFELTKVIFFDQLTPFDDNSLDVSETFIGDDPMSIRFESENLSYTVDPGSSLNFFGTEGSWSFDNNDFPTYLNFVPSDENETTQTSLLRTIRPQDDQLQISLGGSCEPDAISYQLYFTRK